MSRVSGINVGSGNLSIIDSDISMEGAGIYLFAGTNVYIYNSTIETPYSENFFLGIFRHILFSNPRFSLIL